MHELMDDASGPAIDDCQETKNCIQNTDAKEVGKGSEMTHSLFLRWVIDIHGHLMNGDVRPSGEHQQFQLGLLARGDKPLACQTTERIEPVARLCVRQGNTRLDLEPEIGELVGEGAA